jgi:hypothetical protein
MYRFTKNKNIMNAIKVLVQTILLNLFQTLLRQVL